MRDESTSINRMENNDKNVKIPLLFSAYPGLNKLPYQALGGLQATPIIHAWDNLYVKNDGAPGCDKTKQAIFTGNKRRKLEFLLAEALAQGKTRVVVMGAAGSNFCLATAAYARELGLKCTMLLGKQRNTRYAQRNLKLDLYYGAEILSYPDRAERHLVMKNRAIHDPASYVIEAYGGSTAVGAIGYVNAAFELKQQIESNQTKRPDVIYLVVSSAGMAAGLIVGLRAAGLNNIEVKPVRIDGTADKVGETLSNLVRETSSLLNEADPTFPAVGLDPAELDIVNDAAGDEHVPNDHAERHRAFDAYALATPETASAIRELNERTGIKLDGTYSGKAFAACLRDMRSGSLDGKIVLFWDSFCSGEFEEHIGTVDTTKLPEELQKYINEDTGYEIQDFDQGV